MIHDFEDSACPDRFDADLCIIGSGAAGLALAEEFLGQGKFRVVVLESGGRKFEPRTQSLYDGVMSGRFSWGVNHGRFRVFGGSTTQWAGQALPLMPLDFKVRDWVPNSGWPITCSEVSHYYPRAARFLKLDQWDFDNDLFKHLPARQAGFDPEIVWQHFSKWSPQPDLSVVYRRRLATDRGIRVVLHANVIDLRLDASGRCLETVEFRTLDGRVGRVRAKAVVLCAGGVETARLLLACRSQRPAGLGNEYDQVGRYFQDHLCWRIGVVKAADLQRVMQLFSAHIRGRRRYTPRLTLEPAFQGRMKILNASGYLSFEAQDGSVHESMRRVYQDLKSGTISGKNLLDGLRSLARGKEALRILAERYLRGRDHVVDAKLAVHVLSEQAPDPESRITLHPDRTDEFGMPLTDVRWRLGELQNATVRVAARTFAQQFRHAAIGELELAPWLRDPAGDWNTPMSDFNHHIGTCRMSALPSRGVVNSDCRLHSVDNLFLAGSAVFPTGGHSNPTYTIIALAKRLADHLKGA